MINLTDISLVSFFLVRIPRSVNLQLVTLLRLMVSGMFTMTLLWVTVEKMLR